MTPGGAVAPAVIKLLHVATGLGGGGAEFMLARLCAALPREEFSLHVVSLTGDGPVAAHLRALDVPVTVLDLRGGRAAVAGVCALVRCLRTFAPDVVQTWLCHADLIGGVTARLAVHRPVIWGVHQAEYDSTSTPWSTRAVLTLCAWLSARIPARVVSCSEAGRRARIAAGFPAATIEVIANGVDLAQFKPDPSARAQIRRELGVADDTLLVGLAARWHADKDHATFCAAAALVLATCPEVRFVLLGAGIDAGNSELARLLAATGEPRAFRLLGFRDDMPALLAALDVGVLSSRNEAFPNVVTETMACAVPFVATAAGDVAQIIGDTGRVVLPHTPAALAAALIELAQAPRERRLQLGAAARERVAAQFSLARTVARYQTLYRGVAAVPR